MSSDQSVDTKAIAASSESKQWSNAFTWVDAAADGSAANRYTLSTVDDNSKGERGKTWNSITRKLDVEAAPNKQQHPVLKSITRRVGVEQSDGDSPLAR